MGQAGIHIQVWKIGRRLEVRLRESSYDVPGTHRLLVHVMPLPAAVKPAAVDQKTRKHIKAGRLCCHITWHSPCANCGQQQAESNAHEAGRAVAVGSRGMTDHRASHAELRGADRAPKYN